MKPDPTDAQLISKAINAVSDCNWTIGQCADEWCERHKRGRTVGDFAKLIGLAEDKTRACQRVWQRFGIPETFQEFPSLKWSHFHAVYNDEDAQNSLKWSVENSATVAELKAFRRMNRGEDLTEEPDPDAVDDAPETRPRQSQPAASSDTSDTLRTEPITTPAHDPAEASKTTAAAAPAYSPFRADTLTQEREPDANQIDEAKRVERCLAKLGTAARECAAIGSGRWYDLLRDQLDNLAECARQHEKPDGLDSAAIKSTIKRIQNE